MTKLTASLLSAGLAVAATTAAGQSTILFDNIGNTSQGADVYSGTSWRALNFTTDGQPYTLNSVTLLLIEKTPGGAQVDIYSGNSQPTTWVGTLTSPGTYPSSLAPVTFTAAGTSLTANGSYWVTLHALGAGTIGWSWTRDNAGAGAGFSTKMAASRDAGAFWIPYANSPYQMNLTASAVPEPGAWAILLLSVGGLALRPRRRRQAA